MQHVSLPDRMARSMAMRVGWWLLIVITILHGLAAGYLSVGLTEAMAGSPDAARASMCGTSPPRQWA